MATKEEEGTGASAAPTVVGLALSGSKSCAYVLRWALAKFAKDDDGNPVNFKLIHVLTPVLGVPTPMGNHIPIDETREEIAHDYQESEWIRKQKMLVRCKDACDENKIEAQVLLVEGTSVPDTISSLVAQYQIQILVVGNPSSTSIFTRLSSGSRTSSKICKSLPSFCTAYIVSKDGSSSVYASGSEIGPPSGSVLPKGNSGSSSTEEFTDATSSRSDFPSLPCSGAESSVSSQLQGSDKVPKENSLLSLLLKDREVFDKVPKENSLLALLLKDKKYDVGTELEKLRLELTHIQGAYKLLQDESVDASHQVKELAARRMEVEVQLRKIQTRVGKATDDVQEEMAHRLAAEEVATRVKDLVRAEVMQKSRLLAKASKDADRKSRLEKLLILQVPDHSYSTFTWEEIYKATESLSESLKIGSGSNGTVYKGHVNDLDVAIKVLHSIDSTSTKHFNQELEVLSRIRHPHLLMLLGACLERGCLVYEYMEKGSLADRLEHRNRTPPIPWFDRFRIACEIASALGFLHNTKPNPIIHRDLKPENVLLDSNLLSKIGDVGLSTLMPPKDPSSRTMYKKTALAGTLFYLDPEYQRTGQVSVKSDTYALGMVILELLTARSPIGLPEAVERAVEDDQITDVLDKSAGDWPVKEARALAQLGLRCLEMRSKDRPDLRSMVAVELEWLKHMVSSGPPSKFICPILKRVMKEPCLASDGYTYERSAITMWVRDNNVSPVTKEELPDKVLVPNLPLLSEMALWRRVRGGEGL